MKEIREGPAQPCDEHAFACGLAAHRSGDKIRQERACLMGFGEICADLGFGADDDDLRRDYFELACQQEARGGCYMLGKLLAPGCEDVPEMPEMKCLPSDARAAAEASALACEGGMAEACE
jgi:hypothetical protein